MTETIEGRPTLIGARIPKLDAPSKVTGAAQYLQDISLPGMLHGKILRTDRVHALIKSIDTSAAEASANARAVPNQAAAPR